MNKEQTAVQRAAKIKLLLLDVDGVLTTGHIVFGQTGEAVKLFHVHDGMGISLAQRAGLRIAIITGRKSEIVALRGAELHIADIFQGTMNKEAAFRQLLVQYGLSAEQTAFVGDDLNDLPVLVQAGLACAVANAVSEVKEKAHFVSSREGGYGAVREVIEMILKAQNKWDEILAGYLQADSREIRQ